MSTLKDVASMAGVSPATASLAINGKSVNEKTRKRVLDCATKLNYVPNKIGQTLITGKSNTIHLVILNSSKYANLVVDTSFFYYYIEGVLEAASAQGYSVTFDVRNWEDPDLKEYFYSMAHGKSVDGIIIIPQYIRPYMFSEILGDFPCVILNPHTDEGNFESFCINNYLGGCILAEYMKTCGFSDIAFINGPEEHFDASQRRKGFFDIISSSGSSGIVIAEEHGDWTIRSGYEAAGSIFKKKRVEAVFCGNDYMASGVFRFLSQNGYKVPEDVSLIGYDNVGLSRAVYPRLTTVDSFLSETGLGMGNLLLRKIGAIKKEQPAILTPKLIIRESSKPIN